MTVLRWPVLCLVHGSFFLSKLKLGWYDVLEKFALNTAVFLCHSETT